VEDKLSKRTAHWREANHNKFEHLNKLDASGDKAFGLMKLRFSWVFKHGSPSVKHSGGSVMVCAHVTARVMDLVKYMRLIEANMSF